MISTNTTKHCTLTELVAHIQKRRIVLAIGGGLSWREPMAALRELIRQGIKDLKADWLGAVASMWICYVAQAVLLSVRNPMSGLNKILAWRSTTGAPVNQVLLRSKITAATPWSSN